jgi:hypothetical protein
MVGFALSIFLSPPALVRVYDVANYGMVDLAGATHYSKPVSTQSRKARLAGLAKSLEDRLVIDQAMQATGAGRVDAALGGIEALADKVVRAELQRQARQIPAMHCAASGFDGSLPGRGDTLPD